MLPFLRLGPFLLQLPELTLVLGISIGAYLAEKDAKTRRLKPDDLNNLVYYGFFAAIIGARLVYALKYFDVYLDDPLALLSLSTASLAIPEGLAFGLIVSVLYGYRRQLPSRPTLDALAPGLAVFMMALALSHFLAGTAYGSPTQLPWAISLWDEQRHPTQIYELLTAIGIFVVIQSQIFSRQVPGTKFLVTVSLFTASRIFLEAFRAESILLLGGLRAAQVVGLSILLCLLWLAHRWGKENTN